MLPALRELGDRIRRLDKTVRTVTTKQVFQKPVKEESRDIVDEYFRNIRPQLEPIRLPVQHISDIDGSMHRLLEVAQKNSVVQSYRDTTKVILNQLLAVEKIALQVGAHSSDVKLEPIDHLILETLTRLLPSAACSYEQAVRDIHSKTRKSWRGPATDLRETLRETLDHLAPDSDVMADGGFRLEKDTSAPTMKQKVRFILRKRGMAKSATQSPETAAQAVDELVGTFVRSVYSRSSVSTHTPTDRDEILRIRDWVRVALCELLAIRVGA